MPTQATNTTPNYHLSQWEENDRILRQDFNADFAAIDSALAAKAGAAELTALQEKLSLTRLFDATLEADASSVVMDLSGVDMSRCTKLELHISNVVNTLTNGTLGLRINGQESDTSYTYGTTDVYSRSYIEVAETSTYRELWAVVQLGSAGSKLWSIASLRGTIEAGSQYSTATFAANSTSTLGIWQGGDLPDVETLTLFCSYGSICAGMRVTLYGYFA
ncbi:MAG: hypothetical protein ACI3WR_07480 [Oscillospiraceae bacterium]